MKNDFVFYEIRSNEKELKQTQEFQDKWIQVFGNKFIGSANNRYIEVELKDLLDLLTRAKNDLDFNQFVDLSCLYAIRSNSYKICYSLKNLFNEIRLTVATIIKEDDVLPSISEIWSGSSWAELEIYDLFGISFSTLYSKRLLTSGLEANFPFNPHKKLQKTKHKKIEQWQSENVEQANSISFEIPGYVDSGIFDLDIELDDDLVKSCHLGLGYQHKAVEKTCEKKAFSHIIPLVERLNFNSPLLNTIGYCHALESAAGVEISDHAKALRMVFGEFHRILDHLNLVGQVSYHMRIDNAFDLVGEARDRIKWLLGLLSEGEIIPSLICFGGVKKSLPRFWLSHALEITFSLMKIINELQTFLSINPLFLEKSKVGRISARQALKHSFSGPNLRASGINYDLRRSEPYYFYGQVDFNVPLGINGQVFDRVMVRISESLESLKIISQVLDNLPASSKESNPGIETLHDLEKDHYSATEAANGELGFFCQFTKKSGPHRLKIRTPSFYHLQALEKLLVEKPAAEVMTTFISLSISGSELER